MEKYLRSICYAQLASDAAKDNITINDRFTPKSFYDNPYKTKSIFIIDAIDRLDHTKGKRSGHYFVKKDHEFHNGLKKYTMYIVLFNVVYNNKRLQFSFHQPCRNGSGFDDFFKSRETTSSNRVISWRKNCNTRRTVHDILLGIL